MVNDMENKESKNTWDSLNIKDSLWGCFSISIVAAYLIDNTLTIWRALKFAAILTVPALVLWTVGAVISLESKKQKNKCAVLGYKIVGFAVYAAAVWAILN
jgi:hypothetical protein